MTRLLVSVRDAREASRAVRGGADLIDVKEPRRGPLGAADARVWREIRAAVPDRVPVSVALGELRELPEASDGDERTSSLARVEWAKLGLAGCAERSDWSERWRRELDRLPASTNAVAVAYADWRRAGAPDPEQVVDVGASFGCGALLLDTFDKTRGHLFRTASRGELAGWVRRAGERGMLVVLGGSLSLDCLPRALELNPHYVAVRTAVCDGNRAGRLRSERVRQWTRALSLARR